MGRIHPRSIVFVDSQVRKDSRLVRWVKLWPIIFDESDPLHFDAVERRKIWEIIAENLQSTAQVCEERWKTLLDSYETCKQGTIVMHETLYELLEECLDTNVRDANGISRELDLLMLTTSEEDDDLFFERDERSI
ncbi:hypothetical protein NQ318_018799 [Aromia moschata]|uniref:MADF domain-containing protein n=1 Tax=Aromia moschata TaxID=1265417 RepID=A0AAV8ZGJ4_9CUCU|nr:hypothetical protein NQ318_018799 [Aromia moschata]